MKLLNSALSVLHDLRTVLAGNARSSTERAAHRVNHPSLTEALVLHLEDRNRFKAKEEASIFTADQG